MRLFVPISSWVSISYAIDYTGATPVFVDIDPNTWCVDPKAIRKAITPKTKAIMLVHMFGQPAEMDEIMSIAKEYNCQLSGCCAFPWINLQKSKNWKLRRHWLFQFSGSENSCQRRGRDLGYK